MISESKNGRVPDRVSPAEEIKFSPLAKRWTVTILVGLLIVFLLHVAEVLPPFVWAAATAFIFNGLIKTLCKRFGGQRWVWTAVIFAIFFAILSIGLALLIPALAQEGKTLATDAPVFRRQVDDYLNQHDTVQIVGGIEITADTARNAINSTLDRVQTLAQDVGPRLLSGTFRVVIDFLLYLITTFYLMLLGGRGISRFINTLPLCYRGEIRELFGKINTVLSAYIRGQVLLVLIMSVASSIVLSILGVRYSLLLGIMTGILELIPFVGPYLAIAISSSVAFFQPHGNFGLSGLGLVALTAVALFILRQLEDYVVIPNVIGKLVELPALLIIFTTVTGAALLGPIGLLLGVPIVAVIKIVVGYLYYKLVDADREKVLLNGETSPDQLLQIINNQPDRGRILVVAGEDSEYLRDPQLLQHIHESSARKGLDVAFYCGENEKTCEAVREAGFPITTLEQEQFFNSSMH